jgi:cephalosporin hydroxylase
MPDLLRRLRARAERSPRLRRAVLDAYTRWYYDAADTTWKDTRWRGVHVTKSPLDLWTYQDLLHRIKPEVVVETGTLQGGSALFMADVMDLAGTGRIVSIDVVANPGRGEHPRIEYVVGSSVDPAVVARVREAVGDAAPVMVVLDSDHRAAHVAAELEAYHGLVTPGSYLVVEDGIVNGHPVEPHFGPGPTEALRPFLAAHPEFVPDPACERFGMTFNPGGWLRRVR